MTLVFLWILAAYMLFLAVSPLTNSLQWGVRVGDHAQRHGPLGNSIVTAIFSRDIESVSDER